jgi:hypothetical protein
MDSYFVVKKPPSPGGFFYEPLHRNQMLNTLSYD